MKNRHNLMCSRPSAITLAIWIAMGSIFAGPAAAQSTEKTVMSANWSGNVTVTSDGTFFRYQSNGLPNHALAETYLVPIGQQQPFTDFEIKRADDFVIASPIDVTIPLMPVYSDTVTQTSLGMIGVTISGAPLFNDYENPQRSIIAMDDQHIEGGAAFLDTCNGHPLQSGNSYHYHASPPCVTEAIDTDGEHSTMIGVLLDGFPIYGPQDVDGTIVTNADLDECSGHFGQTPEFSDGIYHYHLTTEDAPYSIDCYRGEVDASVVNAMNGRPGGEAPDFATIAATLGVSQNALMDALGTRNPPDFDAAATELGVTMKVLRAAMPPPPN